MRLNLTPDELLTTTRSVRRRLDLERPVEPEVVRECLEIAVQAPTGGNSQIWHWVVVSDQGQRDALAEIYRKAWGPYREMNEAQLDQIDDPAERRTQERVIASAQYLADHLGEVPVHVIPCLWGRFDDAPSFAHASLWGCLLPAAWSFMLAARERGLGTCWTTLHLMHEQEAAEVLGIPFDLVSQGLLIPVAYSKGTDFKAAGRKDLDGIVHWDRW